ncbi:MAG: hypothetical protein HC878_00055 [Leptolyngbyaceae cyanobacterium SL_5_14]|nr:hypothetical protein [Leptolyngbyaceae cyanobacterium SL_5_14]
MTNPAQAWSEGKPVLARLPQRYKSNNLTSWIVNYWDAFLVFQKYQVDALLEKNLNGKTCDSEYLDFLGYLSFYNARFWDSSWEDAAKRKLICGSDIVWNYFGTFTSLSYVLSAFDIKHKLQNVGDFIVDVSQVGDPLGDITWSYRIYLPTEYQGTETEEKVKKLNYLFGVGYCESEIIFDASRFVEVDILLLDDDRILLTDDNQTIELQ